MLFGIRKIRLHLKSIHSRSISLIFSLCWGLVRQWCFHWLIDSSSTEQTTTSFVQFLGNDIGWIREAPFFFPKSVRFPYTSHVEGDIFFHCWPFNERWSDSWYKISPNFCSLLFNRTARVKMSALFFMTFGSFFSELFSMFECKLLSGLNVMEQCRNWYKWRCTWYKTGMKIPMNFEESFRRKLSAHRYAVCEM